MPRIELTELERKKLADAGRGFVAKHRTAQEIEIAELKNQLALARQKKTLRDEFAMAAMQSLILIRAQGRDCHGWASSAYEVADAMMKARQETSK